MFPLDSPPKARKLNSGTPLTKRKEHSFGEFKDFKPIRKETLDIHKVISTSEVILVDFDRIPGEGKNVCRDLYRRAFQRSKDFTESRKLVRSPSAMIRKLVGGFEALLTALAAAKDQKKTFVYFIGDRDAIGNSWCPDCRDSDPVVSDVLKQLESLDILVITSEVGEKAYWKDSNNAFRNTEKLKISSIPTIIEWNTTRRITDADCSDPNKVKDFLSA